MTKILFILLYFPLASTAFGQILIGTYVCEGKATLKIRDNSYVQKVTDCTFAFTTQGTYKQSGDTLTLLPDKIIDESGKRTSEKISTDNNDYIVGQAKRMTKYLIRGDSLVQLKYFSDDTNEHWTLVKKK